MRIEFPDWYDQDAEIDHQYKGYVEGVFADTGKERIRYNFFEPTRLLQEIQHEINSPGYFFEGYVVVVPQVNKAQIENALRKIHKNLG